MLLPTFLLLCRDNDRYSDKSFTLEKFNDSGSFDDMPIPYNKKLKTIVEHINSVSKKHFK